MRERLRFIVIYFVFWVIFFVFARVLFLSYHIDTAKLLTLETVYGVFKNGLLMDLAMAGFYSIFPFLWITFSNFIDKGLFQNTIFSYTFILMTISNLIIVVDLEVFTTWNFRLDSVPLRYLSSPKEAFISVKSSPILRLFVSYVLLVIVASVIIYRILANRIYDWKHIKNFPFILYGLLATAFLIVPIRGGFKKSSLRQDSVYFSDNYFANVAALNAPWNFVNSLLKKAIEKDNPYIYLPKEEVDKNIKQLFTRSGETDQVLKLGVEKTNVVFVVLRNFSSKLINHKYDGIEVTRNFNRLIQEGLFFDNFYASSDNTDKGLTSIVSGYPAQPKEPILDFVEKLENLPFLSKDFNALGYSTQFYFGGDARTLKPYLFQGNFEKIIEQSDYNGVHTSLGVSDASVYDKFLEEHRNPKMKPFFSMVLTLSGLEPFEIPETGITDGKDLNEQFYNAQYYSDKALGQFIEKAKKEEWWDNTLIVVVSDHGHRLPNLGTTEDNFKIPMLWLGGAVSKSAVIQKTAGQTDIASTLLAQLHMDRKAYKWSKNIFDTKSRPWAFYVFNNGFGFVNSKRTVVYDNVGKKVMNDPQLNTSVEVNLGKTLQQRTFQDFLDL